MMLELSPIQWFFIGIVVSVVGFTAFMIIGACIISSRWSRFEEKRENSMKVENWKATPDRLAMTRRNTERKEK